MQFETRISSQGKHKLIIDDRIHLSTSSTKLSLELIEFCKQVDQINPNESVVRQLLVPFANKMKRGDSLLCNGNTVWNTDMLVKDLNKLLNKYKIENFTDYLYKFFTLSCGTIAHYNRHTWWGVFQPASVLLEFVKNLEKQSTTPDWQPDVAWVKTKLAEAVTSFPGKLKYKNELKCTECNGLYYPAGSNDVRCKNCGNHQNLEAQVDYDAMNDDGN